MSDTPSTNALSESILDTIKHMLGDSINGDDFDIDIVVNINSSLAVLTQVGLGPRGGFFISGPNEKWSDFVGDNIPALGMAKTYIYAKAKIVFDPPQSSAALEALKTIASEFEWRINVGVDPGNAWKE